MCWKSQKNCNFLVSQILQNLAWTAQKSSSKHCTSRRNLNIAIQCILPRDSRASPMLQNRLVSVPSSRVCSVVAFPRHRRVSVPSSRVGAIVTCLHSVPVSVSALRLEHLSQHSSLSWLQSWRAWQVPAARSQSLWHTRGPAGSTW